MARIVLVLAILAMHSLVAHCGPNHEAAVAHSTSSPILAAAHESSGQTHLSATPDCDEPGHGCVFIRAGDPVLPFLVLLLFWWGFPDIGALRSRFLGWVVRLGRPPPWAIPTITQLQVIRC
ncbi:hypothetical protein ACWDTI_01500 [Gordonia sp. NPDC003424]